MRTCWRLNCLPPKTPVAAGSERAAAEETDEAEWAAKEAARGVKDVLRLAPIILAGCGERLNVRMQAHVMIMRCGW